MPRTRFAALPEEQQRTILEAAFDEFSTHGYAAASLNRIIRQAGTSKGSLYYYFEDKQDLYDEVIRSSLDQLLGEGTLRPLPTGLDADGFWAAVHEQARTLMSGLTASPALLALLRDALGGRGGADAARYGADTAAAQWVSDVITVGQSSRAVRTDLPSDLLVAVTLGMTLAMDAWLLGNAGEDDDDTVEKLMGMIRRTLAPV